MSNWIFNFGGDKRQKTDAINEQSKKMQYKKWITFYRQNFDICAEHYLQLKNLKLFQKIMIHLMGISEMFVTVASRGISKSYTIALYCIIRCILYPNTKIVVSSGTKGQAALIVKEKIIGEFYKQSAPLRLEIESWSISQNNVEVKFKNGSRIFAVTSSEFSRGYRGNVLVLDEFRMIKPEIRDGVLIPMLSVPRQPGYDVTDPRFKDIKQEENIQVYISSAYYASEWIYSYSKKTLKDFLNGKVGSYFLAMDYKLALHERLTTEKYIDMQRNKMDEVSFAMEFDTIFYGQSKNSLFPYSSLKALRVLKDSFKAIKNEDYMENRGKHRNEINKNKVAGEIRLIGVDVALIGGESNDASQFVCMRLIPKGNRYVRKIDYIESIEGEHSFTQSIKLKRLFEDYCADFVVMDCNGISAALYEQTSMKQHDDERGVDYEAWGAINSEVLKSRVISDTPQMVVYSIIADQYKNHEYANTLRQCINDGYIELLLEEQDAMELMIKDGVIEEFAESDLNSNDWAMKKAELLRSNYQTTALINELINLDYTVEGGLIKVSTKKRKDRYSATSYANFFAKLKEDENLKIDDSEYENQGFAVRELRL